MKHSCPLIVDRHDAGGFAGGIIHAIHQHPDAGGHDDQIGHAHLLLDPAIDVPAGSLIGDVQWKWRNAGLDGRHGLQPVLSAA
jgi:hypothetical protein